MENEDELIKADFSHGSLLFACGFAFIAYPAEYRSSGVMTFLVDQRGVMYEKDLGPDTIAIATTMTDYNPDSTWHQVD